MLKCNLSELDPLTAEEALFSGEFASVSEIYLWVILTTQDIFTANLTLWHQKVESNLNKQYFLERGVYLPARSDSSKVRERFNELVSENRAELESMYPELFEE